MHLDIRASLNPKGEKYNESYEKVYGWKCFYCRQEGKTILTKKDSCPECGRLKEEAEI